MIIQEEYICKNGIKQIHTYSDTNHYVLQNETGIEYVDVYDNGPIHYTYSETEHIIEGSSETDDTALETIKHIETL